MGVQRVNVREGKQGFQPVKHAASPPAPAPRASRPAAAADPRSELEQIARVAYQAVIERASQESPEGHREYLAKFLDQEEDLSMVDTGECAICGKTGSVLLADADYRAGSRLWKGGVMIQDAYPMLTPSIREQLKTGLHPRCLDGSGAS